MGHAFSFAKAVETLQKLIPSGDDDDSFDLRDSIECIVLDHRPTTASEAATIIELLLENAQVGGRSDGRDIKALTNLYDWSLGLAAQSADSPIQDGYLRSPLRE